MKERGGSRWLVGFDVAGCLAQQHGARVEVSAELWPVIMLGIGEELLGFGQFALGVPMRSADLAVRVLGDG